MSVREALSAPGGMDELAGLLEVHYYRYPAGVKVGLFFRGVPSIWRATLYPSGEVVQEGVNPDTQLLYGFVGDIVEREGHALEPLVEGAPPEKRSRG